MEPALQMGVLVPGNDAGRLIGKAGVGLREVREKSQCQVKLGQESDSQQNRRCDISGPTVEHIASAVHAIGIRLFGDGASASCKMTVAFPNDYVGGIIGRGGENLKRIRESTGVKLTLIKDAFTDQGDRVGEMEGTQNQLGAAIRIALTSASTPPPTRVHAYAPMPLQPVQVQHDWRQQQGPQGNANSTSPASITQVRKGSGDPKEVQIHMQIPPKYIGGILGKEGSQIKQILADSGCSSVSVTKREANVNERRVVIIGGLDECARAQQMVYQIYADAAQQAGEEVSVSCIMLVPVNCAGSVIGKEGANLKELRDRLNMKVNLSREQIEGFRPCTLVGPIDSILEAERLIQDHILSSDGAKTGVKRSMEPAEYGNSYAPQGGAYSNDYSGNSYAAQSPREPEAKRARVEQQTKMLVPSASAGAVIGKQGSVLKQIRESSGAHVEVVQAAQSPEFPAERVVNLRGSETGRYAAMQKVLAAAFQDTSNVGLKIMVASNLAGAIIGKAGANLKAVREQTGLNVQVERQPINGERMVHANGPMDQVLHAAQMVMDYAEANGRAPEESGWQE